MLNISDSELDDICSHYKYAQGQAYQVLDLWYRRSTSYHKRQYLSDALENANFFDAARRLVDMEHVVSSFVAILVLVFM